MSAGSLKPYFREASVRQNFVCGDGHRVAALWRQRTVRVSKRTRAAALYREQSTLKLMPLARISGLMLLAAACFGQTRDADFAKLADRYFDEIAFRYDPASAT